MVGTLAAPAARSRCTPTCSASRSTSSCAPSSASTRASQLDDLRDALTRVLDRPVDAHRLARARSRRCRAILGLSPWDGFLRDREPRRRAHLPADRAAPRRSREGRRAADRRARDAARRARRGRPADDRRRAARRARDAARRGPRDDGDDALLGVRPPPRRRARAREGPRASSPTRAARGTSIATVEAEYLDATIKEVLRLRPVIRPWSAPKLSQPMEIARSLRMPAGRRSSCRRRTSRTGWPAIYPEPEALPAGALRRREARPVRVVPVRRRRAPVPRDGVRALRAQGGARDGARERAPPQGHPVPARVALRGFTLVPKAGRRSSWSRARPGRARAGAFGSPLSRGQEAGRRRTGTWPGAGPVSGLPVVALVGVRAAL